MFEDSLILSSNPSPNPRRRWIAATSIGVQLLLVGLILLIPMLHPDTLTIAAAAPRVLLMPIPKPPDPPKPQPIHTTSDTSSTAPAPAPMANTRSLLQSLRPAPDNAMETGPQLMTIGPGAMGHPGDPLAGPGIATSGPTVVAAGPPTKLRISAGVSTGMLLSPIRPDYPPIAKATHTQGTVVVTATIDKQGRIVNAQATSGPAMLRGAAVDAVRNARYRPYLLNGQPTDVDTTISVNFIMN